MLEVSEGVQCTPCPMIERGNFEPLSPKKDFNGFKVLKNHERKGKMAGLVFESVIADNTIKIPDEYVGRLPSRVVVTIEEKGEVNHSSSYTPHIIRTKTKTVITEDDFTCIKIDTSKFKFNREEANER
ncbi:MAG: hypothetical protein LBU70_01420 [Chitinispirillales bacterium]|jgi:hypothetical protein|nr:hypothetical protein [Chitinispirillales bacterium]